MFVNMAKGTMYGEGQAIFVDPFKKARALVVFFMRLIIGQKPVNVCVMLVDCDEHKPGR